MPYTKIYLKWLKQLKKTKKLLEENTGKISSDINHSNIFLGKSPEAVEIKATLGKQMESNQTLSFYINKETINKMKRQPMNWKKIFLSDVTSKSLISKILKSQTAHMA